eukprot:6682388-Lingulodinium_polyedra.AAC.1
MGWRSHWPGKLAIFCLSTEQEKVDALRDVHEAWQAFLEAEKLAEQDTFLKTSVLKGCFST